MVQPGRPQTTILYGTCRITKAADKDSEHAILAAFQGSND